jgi:type IX secretion system PorP/SprF family membrane protein
VKKILSILFIGSSVLSLKAQDPQFTQFAANPIYLNPAFTGNTKVHRFTAAYRNQWPGIKKGFTTYMAAYDKNLDEKNSGLGFYVIQDKAGTTGYSSTYGMINYAYRVKFGYGTNNALRMAISAGGGQTKNDFTKLVMNDQFITGASSSQDVPVTNTKNFVDLGTGITYSTNHFWAGYAAKHLNRPVTSIVGANERLPVYMTAHMGYRFVIRPNDTSDANPISSLSLMTNYRHEKKNDQLDLGAVVTVRGLSVGIWYRGLPMKHFNEAGAGSESIAFMLGYQMPMGLRFAYSYDLTVSAMSNGTSSGAHEITLGFEFGKKKGITYTNKKNATIKKRF